MSKWLSVYESTNPFKTQLVKDLLENAQLHPVVLDAKDRSYGFGSIRIMVKSEEVIQAKKIIDDGKIDEME